LVTGLESIIPLTIDALSNALPLLALFGTKFEIIVIVLPRWRVNMIKIHVSQDINIKDALT
jgi:hypothetical protein